MEPRLNTAKVNDTRTVAKHKKAKPKQTFNCKNCSWVCVCTIGVHNTAQNSSDYLPSYPPDNHQCSHVEQ